MKVELTKTEQKELNTCVNNNLVRKWLKIRNELKFEVGDVLVKKIRQGDKWVDENIASRTKMAQRYVYIFEDEEGIGYFKKLLLSTGKLGSELFSITDFDFEHNRFEVDPEYAEHTLLGGEFDIKDVLKKANESKRIATKMNRKLGVKTKTFKEVNAFFEKVMANGVFYTSDDYTGRYSKEYKLTKIEKKTIAEIEQEYTKSYYSRGQWKSRFSDGQIDDTYTYKITAQGPYGPRDEYATDYFGYILYETQPAKPEDK